MVMMQKKKERMEAILENSENNNIDFNMDNLEEDNNSNNSNNYIPNNALLDVISEPNPPNNNNNSQNQVLANSNITNELVTEVIVDVMNLNPDLLSGFGNNLEGQWAHGENRGGRPYNPPDGWIGYGLNVLNKYDNGNNDWLACNGRPGEWCIAYHGACHGQTSDNVKKNIKAILETNLRPGGDKLIEIMMMNAILDKKLGLEFIAPLVLV